MSRPPRSGTAAPRRSFRATDAEWSAWEQAAAAEKCDTLSAWIVKTLNRRVGHHGAVAQNRKARR